MLFVNVGFVQVRVLEKSKENEGFNTSVCVPTLFIDNQKLQNRRDNAMKVKYEGKAKVYELPKDKNLKELYQKSEIELIGVSASQVHVEKGGWCRERAYMPF